MSLPAVDTTLVAPLNPLRLLDRLPARARAALEWTKPRILAALAELRASKLDDADIDRATDTFAEPWKAILHLAFEHLEARQIAESIEASFSTPTSELERLDPYVRDTASDCLANLRAFQLWSVSVVDEHDGQLHVSEEDVDEAMQHPIMRALLRAQVLLLAALLAPAEPSDPDLDAELVAAAYLESCIPLDLLARHGVVIDPHADESPAERGRRTLRAAEAARAVLTEEDLEILASARLRDLR